MAEIGKPSPPTTLHIQQGVDRDFDVQWFEEDGTTVVPLASVEGQIEAIRGETTETALDLTTVTTIFEDTALVRIPGLVADGWDFEEGRWWLKLVSDSGRVKLVAWGPVAFLRIDHA